MARTEGQASARPARPTSSRSRRLPEPGVKASADEPKSNGRGVAKAQPAATESAAAPAWLLRSAVFRKMPADARLRLESAILLRPSGCGTLEAIARTFELKSRYGLSLAALRNYARKLEQWVRPAVASQVMAGVLGCLPDDFRRRLINGSQVLLLSRVNQALGDEDGPPLSVAELAKLADVLKSLARGRAGSAGNAPSDGQECGEHAPNGTELDLEKMTKAVRVLYGLPWPLDAHCEDASPS